MNINTKIFYKSRSSFQSPSFYFNLTNIILLLFSESEEGEVWYYSTPLQLKELILSLDKNEMEVALYRELSDYKEEIVRQMEITETLTNQIKGNKKSYLEVENGELIP